MYVFYGETSSTEAELDSDISHLMSWIDFRRQKNCTIDLRFRVWNLGFRV